MERVSLDSGRQQRARSYAWTRLRLRAVSLGLSVCALLILGPLGGAPGLRDAVMRATDVWQLQVALFFGVLGLAWGIITSPLTYYRGFVLPHHYGQSNQTLRQWLADMGKGAAIGAVLAAIGVETLYGFLRLTPSTWWLWTGIAFTFLTVVLATLAPVIILPLFFKLRPLRDESLAAAILGLAQRAETRVAAVCEIDLSTKSPAANAAVIGLGRTRKIVLGDTLLEQFPPDEVEVVVAHELGHHVHRDLGMGLLVDSALTFAGFAFASVLLPVAVQHWHFAGVWDLGAFPVLALVFGVWGTVSGLAADAFSRWRESAADAYSIALTGLSQTFINSEIRLTNQNLAWFRPPRWVELLFYTHPAPWRRVAMGERHLPDHPEREAAGSSAGGS